MTIYQRTSNRPIINYSVSRHSVLDPNNPTTRSDPLRGFYSLFWILLVAHTISTVHLEGSIRNFRLKLADLITQDLFRLMIVDLSMIASTFSSVIYSKLVQKNYLSYDRLGVTVQHLYQSICKWPWVQSGFLTLHSITMLMKIHSYCTMNGTLSVTLRELRIRLERLESLLISSNCIDQKDQQLSLSKPAKSSISTKTHEQDAISSRILRFKDLIENLILEIEEGKVLEPQTVSDGDDRLLSGAEVLTIEGLEDTLRLIDRLIILKQQPVSDSEDSKIVETSTTKDSVEADSGTIKMTKTITTTTTTTTSMSTERSFANQGYTTYPENVSIANFLDFLLIPTLVYELNYPRTSRIRLDFLLEKMVMTFLILFLIYLVTQYYIWDQIPIDSTIKTLAQDNCDTKGHGDGCDDVIIGEMNLHESGGEQFGRGDYVRFFESVLRLIVPFSINYLLIFYIIFECICNFFAELTRFADRDFYSDWWNSTSFDEFSRKWNKPVHSFLLKHVYRSTIESYGLTKIEATVLTTLLSSLLHELTMTIITRKFRLYLFIAQMTIIPLSMVGRLRFFKSRPRLGNMVFWIQLLSGFPFLGVW
ncbi:MBOAT, membrane-bound O-acyltransferase family-domain-containing protein [Phakopsora pachyrhizi]|uniref:O-acyltransferase n=1 Tax=Phakopsora pachyrhizi TaxID=170000 RepID=A0AAV0B2T5_PHAPC|nr:MBOAT, membrane-bound O-acyltransferase family-domain-containing protein [Phakopsora pachyrhizi]